MLLLWDNLITACQRTKKWERLLQTGFSALRFFVIGTRKVFCVVFANASQPLNKSSFLRLQRAVQR